ncbi:H-2 class II histocompatibility antigen, A-K alpha chain-like [Clupea harengus]|uniref:H-2 class II histocompatibility antigen, A-K alpha chain-like n=1 Tax=Clupea harengus TaxID=7950 RepID=A0A6P8FR35_CLUHA|nr:H-2 class II histocompatibility antigen, A-K alpha chain-like [Clupea harengus]
MTLTWILLVLTGIICTETKMVHVDIGLVGCSDSDGEYMYGLDGEEVGHADFTKGKFVMTLPEFADQLKYEEGTYEGAVANQQICKQNLQVAIESYKSPAVAEAPPMSSIYPRHEVKVGTGNTLICYITGFYPPRLTVRWTKNNKNVTERVSTSQLRPNLIDGSYDQFSTLKFTPQEGDMYTCTVEHSALEGPMTREFDVEVSEPSLGPSVFCGVGLTLGLLGVATGTFFLVKGNQCN